MSQPLFLTWYFQYRRLGASILSINLEPNTYKNVYTPQACVYQRDKCLWDHIYIVIHSKVAMIGNFYKDFTAKTS